MESKKDIAKRLIDEGILPIRDIAEVVEMTPEQVREIAKEQAKARKD